jgi:tight adherence protein C
MSFSFGILGGLFLFVLASVIVVGYFLFVWNSEKSALARREGSGPLIGDEPSAQGARAMIVDTLQIVGQAMPARRDKAESTRKRLIAAGYRWPSAHTAFVGLNTASTVIFAGAMIVVATNTPSHAGDFLVRGLCGAAFGFMLPERLLRGRIRFRQRRLRSGLPAALDLMVLALDAGQSFDQALSAAASGIRNTYQELSSELSLIQGELRAGKTRAEALRHLSDRNREPELTKIANLLIDADRFGTSLAPALRTHARYLRTRFKHKAQESARKVSVKLIFPVFFLIFPAVLLVTLGPAVLQLYTQLKTLTDAVP